MQEELLILSPAAYVGGDVSPGLTEGQVALLRLQSEDAEIRRTTRKRTENVYAGITGPNHSVASEGTDAFPARSLDQACATAAFLSRALIGAFHVIPAAGKAGGYCVLSAFAAAKTNYQGILTMTYGDHGAETDKDILENVRTSPVRRRKPRAATITPAPETAAPAGFIQPPAALQDTRSREQLEARIAEVKIAVADCVEKNKSVYGSAAKALSSLIKEARVLNGLLKLTEAVQAKPPRAKRVKIEPAPGPVIEAPVIEAPVSRAIEVMGNYDEEVYDPFA